MKSLKTLRLGIIGHGFVGKALDHGFSRNVEKFIVDPIYGTDFPDLEQFDPDIIFVCVPTPMGDDGVNSSILDTVVEDISLSVLNEKIVVIKSTITPDHLIRYSKSLRHLVFNPEFLTEANANQDFLNPPMHVFGGSWFDTKDVEEIYLRHTYCRPYPVFHTDYFTASMVKYAINAFLATKVTFFNQMHSIFEGSGQGDYDQFTEILPYDPRIGSSHMKVPGHDGRKGFGLGCFPKDTKALFHFSNGEFDLLSKVMEINNEIRSKYGDVTEREKAHGIKFE